MGGAGDVDSCAAQTQVLVRQLIDSTIQCPKPPDNSHTEQQRLIHSRTFIPNRVVPYGCLVGAYLAMRYWVC